MFPFGFVPYDESQTEADKEFFKVKTNGKDADKTIRHTYKADRFAKFDLTNPDGSVTITGETVDFTKNGGMYETRFEKLPDGDLTLFICASEKPERYNPPLGKVTKIIIILSTGIGLIVIATIILVVTVKKQKTKVKKIKIDK